MFPNLRRFGSIRKINISLYLVNAGKRSIPFGSIQAFERKSKEGRFNKFKRLWHLPAGMDVRFIQPREFGSQEKYKSNIFPQAEPSLFGRLFKKEHK